MTQVTQQFAVADPRGFEGTPYEVAERAALQASAVARILRQTMDATRLMVRNADLERQLAFSGECDVQAFEDSVVARKIDKVTADVIEAERQLVLVSKAASYNPKARIGRP